MAPIVDRTVPIERVALYRAAEGGPHPSAALRLRNSTGASLPAGLATLYEALPDGGLTFLGDAPLPQLAPGARRAARLWPGRQHRRGGAEREPRPGRSGADRGRRARADPRRAAAVHLRRRPPASPGPPRSFVLEQPRPVGWRVAAPADAVVEGETLAGHPHPGAGRAASTSPWCWSGRTSSGSRCSITTRRRCCSSSRAWTPPPELRDGAGPAAGAVGHGGRAGAARSAEATARRDELAQDQARLRENLAAVPAESDLARRYLGRLAASEDELTELARASDRPARGAGAGGAGAARRSSARCGSDPPQASVPGGGTIRPAGAGASLGGRAGCGRA